MEKYFLIMRLKQTYACKCIIVIMDRSQFKYLEEHFFFNSCYTYRDLELFDTIIDALQHVELIECFLLTQTYFELLLQASQVPPARKK